MNDAASEAKNTIGAATSSGRASRRNGIALISASLQLVGLSVKQRSVGGTRAHAVDVDPVPGHLAGERLGERDDAALGAGVDALSRAADPPGVAGDVDHPAAVSGLDHPGQECAAHVHRAEVVDGHDLSANSVVASRNWSVRSHPAAFTRTFGDADVGDVPCRARVIDWRAVGDVDPHRGYRARDGVPRCWLAASRSRSAAITLSPCLRERQCDGSADSGSGSGDDERCCLSRPGERRSCLDVLGEVGPALLGEGGRALQTLSGVCVNRSSADIARLLRPAWWSVSALNDCLRKRIAVGLFSAISRGPRLGLVQQLVRPGRPR